MKLKTPYSKVSRGRNINSSLDRLDFCYYKAPRERAPGPEGWSPCRKCGGTERYADGGCVKCVGEAQKRSKAKKLAGEEMYRPISLPHKDHRCYWGKACPHGHVDERGLSARRRHNHICVECHKEDSKRRYYKKKGMQGIPAYIKKDSSGLPPDGPDK